MPRTRARFVPVLVAALAASGCATTHLSGEYRPYPAVAASGGEKQVLGRHSQWLFLWGLIDTRDFDTRSDLKRNLKEGSVVRDVEITNHESIGGVLLWLITAGIVNHHTVVIEGRPVAPEARPGIPAR